MPTDQLSQPVVVLDLDGTLVDSVYQHVVAWQKAFHEVGLHVGSVKLHESIGMGGDKFVAHVAGEAAEAAVGDKVRELHDQHFREMLRSIQPLEGASELVEALARQGRSIALASSSEEALVDELLDLLDVRRHLTAIITASDGRESKPAPDLIDLAVQQAGGGQAIAIGDAEWDALAATAAGAAAIGLRSGGIGADRLRAAGASSVYDSPRDLFDHLETSALRSR